jgi:hypothetical protein
MARDRAPRRDRVAGGIRWAVARREDGLQRRLPRATWRWAGGGPGVADPGPEIA